MSLVKKSFIKPDLTKDSQAGGDGHSERCSQSFSMHSQTDFKRKLAFKTTDLTYKIDSIKKSSCESVIEETDPRIWASRVNHVQYVSSGCQTDDSGICSSMSPMILGSNYNSLSFNNWEIFNLANALNLDPNYLKFLMIDVKASCSNPTFNQMNNDLIESNQDVVDRFPGDQEIDLIPDSSAAHNTSGFFWS